MFAALLAVFCLLVEMAGQMKPAGTVCTVHWCCLVGLCSRPLSWYYLLCNDIDAAWCFAPGPSLQSAAAALAAREASLIAQQSSLQADLDVLLAKQEERLRSWEAGCADLEAQLEHRRTQLEAEEQR